MLGLFGFSTPDLLALFSYFVGVTVLGLWMGKTVRNTTDFFVAGRRFGKLFSTLFSFGAGTHSDQAVGVVSKTYTSGMSGIWYQWLWMFCTPFYWWLGPLCRRCRAISTADYFEARYGRSVALLYVVVGSLIIMVSFGTMLVSAAAMIGAVTGNAIPAVWAIVGMTALMASYSVVGGFAAAVATDFVQGTLTILFSFMLLPVALYQLGGFSGLHRGVADTIARWRATDPGIRLPDAADMWKLAAPGEIGVYYVVLFAIGGLVSIVAQPHILPGYNVSRTEREAQFGGVAGNLVKRFCTIAWTLIGMCAFVMFSGMTRTDQIDQAYGMMARSILPQLAPGLLGVFTAAMLASIMSTSEVVMVTASALFTHNFYRPLIAPGRSDRHYLFVGRLASAGAVAGGVLVAFSLTGVIQGLEWFVHVSATMGVAFWVGLVWRRATAAGAWASTLAMFGVLLLTSQSWFVEWMRGLLAGDTWLAVHLGPYILLTPNAARIYLPTQILAYLVVGTATLVLVSRFTKAPPSEQIENFYAVLRTPVAPGEVIDRPFHLPAGMAPAPPNRLIRHPDWEIPRPTRRAVAGFIAIWGIVGAIILLVVLLVRIGA